MSDFPGNGKMGEFILKNQVNAISWAVSILSKVRNVTFDDVTRSLAEAETRAQFRCGFVDLEAAIEYKLHLKQYLLDEGFLVAGSDGHLALTAFGFARAENEENKKNLAPHLRLQ